MKINKRWNKLLDVYLATGTMPSYAYDQLTNEQKFIINEIKKSFKRITKHYETTDEEPNYDFDEEDTRVGSENPPY